jgi:hypothetical protein
LREASKSKAFWHYRKTKIGRQGESLFINTELARARGKELATHAHDVVTAYLNGADARGTKSFEEILAPIWEGWRHSGMGESEVDELFEKERQEVRSERRWSKGTT